VRQTDALQQLLEAGVGLESIEARIGIQKDEAAVALPIGTFERSQSAINFSQRRIRFRDADPFKESTAGVRVDSPQAVVHFRFLAS
jgi:hypothetical protein